MLVAASAVVAMLLSSCAFASNALDSMNRNWKGVNATMYTYAFDGSPMDTVHGKSFKVSNDSEFDSNCGENCVKKGSVLTLSIGKSHIEHVGSSLILAQDGLEPVAGGDTKIDITNSESGRPWLNDLMYRCQNLNKGKAKTIIIKSQSSIPLAVYTGDEVELYNPGIDNATQFRIDGKYLFVYRVEYTVYDTDLLTGS